MQLHLGKNQEHLEHIEWHAMILEDQSDTWYDSKVGSKIQM